MQKQSRIPKNLKSVTCMENCSTTHTHTPKMNQESCKYRSGEGLEQMPKLFFLDLLQEMFQKRSQKGERDNQKLGVSTWIHLWRQGLPMELRTDFQGHVLMRPTRVGDRFGRFRCHEYKTNRLSPRARMQEQQTIIPSTTKQVGAHTRLHNITTQARWWGWAKPSG